MSQIAYWSLALLALLQFFVCLPMSGIWGWIFRFPIAVVGWSACWFVIAKLHNLVADDIWQHSNYTWEQGKEIWDGLSTFVAVLWQAASHSFFENITTALHQANIAIAWLKPDLGDLGHLNIVLFATLFLSAQDSPSQTSNKADASELKSQFEPQQPQSQSQPHTQAQTIPNGPVDYRSLVDPDSVRALSVSLVSEYPQHGTGQLLRAAALFEYVKNNVTYVPDPIRMENQQLIAEDLIASPTETLRIRGGDCDDHAVLMASLLSAVGIANRMHKVKSKDDSWHLLTEFAVDVSIHDDIVATLDNFYDSIGRSTGTRAYWFFKEGPLVWLLADTTRSYVPDYLELVQSGFMVKNPDNSINCHHLDSTY
jgi:hypothetical protein